MNHTKVATIPFSGTVHDGMAAMTGVWAVSPKCSDSLVVVGVFEATAVREASAYATPGVPEDLEVIVFLELVRAISGEMAGFFTLVA